MAERLEGVAITYFSNGVSLNIDYLPPSIDILTSSSKCKNEVEKMQHLDKTHVIAGKESEKAVMNENRIHHMDRRKEGADPGPMKVTLGEKRAGITEEKMSHLDRNMDMAGPGADKLDARAEMVGKEEKTSEVVKRPTGLRPKKIKAAIRLDGERGVRRHRRQKAA
ncbi:MAG TPA: hypothetical protein VLH13_00365 [Methanomassiliicoccales archaeon]|nr:hypothetical protein [Methanomassiliicoccales archaeon]